MAAVAQGDVSLGQYHDSTNGLPIGNSNQSLVETIPHMNQQESDSNMTHGIILGPQINVEPSQPLVQGAVESREQDVVMKESASSPKVRPSGSRRRRSSTVNKTLIIGGPSSPDNAPSADGTQASPKRKLPAKRSRQQSPAPSEIPKKRPKIQYAPPGSVEVQAGTCHSKRYADAPRCLACISKKVGEPCRFRDIRSFIISEEGTPGKSVFQNLPQQASNETPHVPAYNDKWYQPISGQKITSVQITRVKTSVARVLLPKLQEEVRHLSENSANIIRRQREKDVRVTCDRCLTSIFATSFLCTSCGREFCIECFTFLRTIDPDHPPDVYLDNFTACGGIKRTGRTHNADGFLPVSRMELKGLESTIHEMATILQTDDQLYGGYPSHFQSTTTPGDIPYEQKSTKSDIRTEITEPTPISSRIGDIGIDPGWCSLPKPLETDEDLHIQGSNMNEQSQSADLPNETPLQPDLQKGNVTPEAIVVESLSFETFHHSEFTQEKFQSLWSEGKTMVVTDLLTKMKGKWTPQYFIDHHGSEKCSITDCDDESQAASNVADFFQRFGQYDSRDKKILKLKDWPPTADFKTTFPTLFDDFQAAVPAPEYTRRDGFYNISAHFPLDTVAPDMGPKMYNALASREDGKGSTRLHMDMADAVNIMLYSETLPNGQEGSAVWDIYPSGASNLIRTFLKEEFPLTTSAISYVDPIHSQYFYLTPTLRQKLSDKYGVKGWRIYQKPGNAVFIPAGCAHQVCNLADCIKVAVDFVSPENLARCAQLTQEFRNENERVAWKEDILQLSNMCWSAWEHMLQLEKNDLTQ
ncbi:hypothetical protein CPB86DRAFT_871842 [Serendipita vermifera]|nr:hypothetical protein CPB86DRAFT_871842 [Serendipita vermifera]